MNNVPTWNEYYINMCHIIKTRSKDPKRQVGACLVSLKDNRVISCGFNGLMKGANDLIDWNDRELVNDYVLHAEQNALLHSNSKFEDTILYSSTSPCKQCIKLIAAANIKKIMYDEEYKDIVKVREICNFYNIELIKYIKN